jgi:cell shape-determining protein MreD
VHAAVRFVLGLALAVVVHFVGARLFPGFPRVIDVFQVVVVLYGLSGDSFTALLAGLAVGLIEDTLTGGLYGLYGFADTIVGYGTARLAQRLVIQRATGVFAVAGVASLAQQGIVVGLAWMLFPGPSLPRPQWVGIKAVACGALAMLVYAATERFRHAYDVRRRSRMSRLRLG